MSLMKLKQTDKQIQTNGIHSQWLTNFETDGLMRDWKNKRKNKCQKGNKMLYLWVEKKKKKKTIVL